MVWFRSQGKWCKRDLDNSLIHQLSSFMQVQPSCNNVIEQTCRVNSGANSSSPIQSLFETRSDIKQAHQKALVTTTTLITKRWAEQPLWQNPRRVGLHLEEERKTVIAVPPFIFHMYIIVIHSCKSHSNGFRDIYNRLCRRQVRWKSWNAGRKQRKDEGIESVGPLHQVSWVCLLVKSHDATFHICTLNLTQVSCIGECSEEGTWRHYCNQCVKQTSRVSCPPIIQGLIPGDTVQRRSETLRNRRFFFLVT